MQDKSINLSPHSSKAAYWLRVNWLSQFSNKNLHLEKTAVMAKSGNYDAVFWSVNPFSHATREPDDYVKQRTPSVFLSSIQPPNEDVTHLEVLTLWQITNGFGHDCWSDKLIQSMQSVYLLWMMGIEFWSNWSRGFKLKHAVLHLSIRLVCLKTKEPFTLRTITILA